MNSEEFIADHNLAVSNELIISHQGVTLNRGDQGLTTNEQDFISTLLQRRMEFFSRFMDPRRNVEKECGYPETSSMTCFQYRRIYERDAVAARVVEVMPEECWQTHPEIYDDEDESNQTDFEIAWNNLGNQLRGKSWYKKEKNNPVWEYLKRIDILSGIGSYGLLFFGWDDGEELEVPLKGFENGIPEQPLKEGSINLLYLRCFDESLAIVTQWETDKNNPRYCQPNMYQLTFYDPQSNNGGGIGQPTATKNVHWSRVQHVAEVLGDSSEILATPRMRPVFNRLADLSKLYGGSAEMYWKGAFPGLSIETNPQLGADIRIDMDKVRKALWARQNSLQRDIILEGMQAKTLAPTVVDPGSQIEVQITAICIKLGIPQRVFMGSERGELASSQDDDSWEDRKQSRQKSYLIPRVIIPFIDRMIICGVLPEPGEEGYFVDWDMDKELTPQEQSQIALATIQTITAYMQGGCDNMITPLDFWTRIMDYTEEEATEILEAVLEHMAEANPGVDPDTLVPGHAPMPAPGFDEQGNPLPEQEDPNADPTQQGGGGPPTGNKARLIAMLRSQSKGFKRAEEANHTAHDSVTTYLNNYSITEARDSHGRWENTDHTQAKADIRRSNYGHVAKDVQRYSENVNEPHLAKVLGAKHVGGNAPIDLSLEHEGTTHGIELKTLVSNNYGKLKLHTIARKSKMAWEQGSNNELSETHPNPRQVHTVVFDDQKAYQAKPGRKHDLSKRKIYYRRGFGSWQVKENMHRVKNYAELKQLIITPTDQLPEKAKP